MITEQLSWLKKDTLLKFALKCLIDNRVNCSAGRDFDLPVLLQFLEHSLINAFIPKFFTHTIDNISNHVTVQFGLYGGKKKYRNTSLTRQSNARIDFGSHCHASFLLKNIKGK